MALLDPRQVIAPFTDSLIAVPAAQGGVCRVCHSSANPGYPTCRGCADAELALGSLTEILPIALTTTGRPLYTALRAYKADSVAEQVRATHTMQAAALLTTFVRTHAACIGAYDVVTAIPSAKRRTAVRTLIQRITGFRDNYEDTLVLREGFSTRDLAADRFGVVGDQTDLRILIIDDTFTTGASVFSAAAALERAGATVVATVVIGRFVRQEWAPTKDLLRRLEPHPWDPDRCVRCGPIKLAP